MLINKTLLLTSAVGLALGMSSCKKYLDVNTNPNISQIATVQTLLPAAQLYVGSAVGVDLQVNGSIWAQFWTQTPIASQYISLEQYSAGQDAFQYPWSNLYSGASNFYQLGKLADSLKKRPYAAISLLMQAYTFQLLTDGWGDVPFTDALKGQYSDGHFINPKYDSQRVVYNGILKYIDSANKLLTMGGTAPGSDDLIYSGNMSKWQKFSNTLKLKALVRLAKIDPAGTQARINLFYSTSPVFIGAGDDAAIKYGFSSANKNPLYAEASSATLANIQNLGGSKTCIDSMNNNDDYRAFAFYEYVAAAGQPVGITQGTFNIALPGGSYSIPNVYVAGDAGSSESAKAPVNLLTSWESMFLQAEVVARGWQASSSGMTDDTLFYHGIKASFTYYSDAINTELGVTGVDAYDIYINGDVPNAIDPGYWTVYPASGSAEDKIRFIITQKWFAMCGNQGFEAWTEWRRTGYPDFLVHPASSLIGNQMPRRFIYPTSESTTNSTFPGVQPLTAKVWWDIL